MNELISHEDKKTTYIWVKTILKKAQRLNSETTVKFTKDKAIEIKNKDSTAYIYTDTSTFYYVEKRFLRSKKIKKRCKST